jgi:hypothetical protein
LTHLLIRPTAADLEDRSGRVKDCRRQPPSAACSVLEAAARSSTILAPVGWVAGQTRGVS